MGREERCRGRLQLPSRWMCELGAEAQHGAAAGGGAVTALHHSWFVRTDVSRDAGAVGGRSWEISCFLQRRSDPLTSLVAYKSFDTGAI